MMFKIIFLIFNIFCVSYANAGPSSIIELSASNHRQGTAFVVSKSQRKLAVWSIENNNLKMLSSIDVDIGKGIGKKLKRGDLKTPEGVYFLVSKKTPPEIPFNTYGDIAFTTNYPNYFDLLDGKTGDGIWLHAVPDTTSLNRGSKGCVVVRNDSIKELELFIKLRHTSLIITDDEQEISDETREQLKLKVKTFLENWRISWEKQDMPSFLNFYSDKFNGYGMNYKQWSKFKTRLSLKNKNTQIEQKDFNILRYKNQFVVLFSQGFKSSALTDEGDKILYLSEDENNLKILSEEFLKENI